MTPNGDLIDCTAGGIQKLESAIMTKQLYKGLKQNRVNFDENYQNWEAPIMIEKIGTVMGLDYIFNPDSSYVLTVDNLIKILAIQMRFRFVAICAAYCVYLTLYKIYRPCSYQDVQTNMLQHIIQ